MFGIEEEKKADSILEMPERMEELFSDLRLEYLEMARKYDEAMVKVEDLEADKLYLEAVIAEREAV